ncbi:MAG: hypothetical protein QM654_10040 [Dysgonamonadaceae bacterium]
MYQLSNINNNYDGFQKLISFYDHFKDLWFDDIHLDLKNFFAANMCAALGSILEKMTLQLNDLHISVDSGISKVLRKNHFLNQYGFENLLDDNNTTISFNKFDRSESKRFTGYVMTELMPRQGMPIMSEKLKLRISSAIGEIFANSSMHTDSPFIFACGQFFPQNKTLDFTIADMGEGIRNKVNLFLQEKKVATDAIKWALIDGNTTKKGAPGGYGLSILKDLIGLNKGFMQIVSNEGFYEYNNGQAETYKQFNGEFPGTVINLQFMTDDTAAYCLKSEKI